MSRHIGAPSPRLAGWLLAAVDGCHGAHPTSPFSHGNCARGGAKADGNDLSKDGRS